MKFKCTMCGACCKPHWAGDYQIILFNDSEEKKIAEFLGMELDAMREKYEIVENAMNTSKVPCRFLDENNKCIIHPVKPGNCSKWPWIRANNELRGQEPNAKRCPGIILEDDPTWHR